MEENKKRTEIICKLEEIFRKRVFAIVYNPDIEEGIKNGDEKYIMHFIENVIKKEGIKECIIIFNGFGGNLQTAILCAYLLRQNIQKFECFVPSVIGSSLCYFAFLSDKLLMGNKSKLTQIDPIFNYMGEELRAIKYLSEQKDSEKRILAHQFFNPVLENLRNILYNEPHVFIDVVSRKKKVRIDYIGKLVDLFMGGEFHESGLSAEELKELKINVSILGNETVEIANLLIKKCREELAEEGARFVIQTNKIEDEKYDGGYFHF